MRDDFFTEYLSYTDDGETPTFFNRWAAIVGIGAYLGRNYSFQLGHFHINPNIYAMLIGNPGTRKSTAIKTMVSIMKQAGYTTFSAQKTTKEKFLLDLAGEDQEGADYEEQIFGGRDTEPREMFIAADEFNDFFGNGNLEFVSLLGTLWDYSGTYENRIKNGKSVSIPDPTISILGGNTHTGFATAFPVDIIGQGFFSRLILIHGDPSGKKVTFPELPSQEKTASLCRFLQDIRVKVVGRAELTKDARNLLDKIYKTWKGMEDVRFESYGNRRFNHLIKLCLVHSASRLGTTITEEDVIYANTVLTHTEHLMPRALGEFGKSEHSDVAHKIMQMLDSAQKPITMQEFWEVVIADLKNIGQLGEILRNLAAAKKIQTTPQGFLANRKVIEEDTTSGTVDYSFLTAEEKEMSK